MKVAGTVKFRTVLPTVPNQESLVLHRGLCGPLFGVTIRCLPFGDEWTQPGTCFLTGKPSTRRVIFVQGSPFRWFIRRMA